MPANPTGQAGAALRRPLKVLRDFVSTRNLVQMKPSANLFSGPLPDGVFARALVEPGRSYWIYLRHTVEIRR